MLRTFVALFIFTSHVVVAADDPPQCKQAMDICAPLAKSADSNSDASKKLAEHCARDLAAYLGTLEIGRTPKPVKCEFR